jgi:toxin ParE1/3/4
VTWRVRVGATASADFENILNWTIERFGTRQSAAYAEIIRAALRALIDGPHTPGAVPRPECGTDIYTLHVAGYGRHGRHLVAFRIRTDESAVEVLRILHDAMDLSRHLPRQR